MIRRTLEIIVIGVAIALIIAPLAEYVIHVATTPFGPPSWAIATKPDINIPASP